MPYEKMQDDIDVIMAGAKKHGEENQQKSFPLRPSGALKSDLDLYFDLVNYFKPETIPKDEMEGRVHILLESAQQVFPRCSAALRRRNRLKKAIFLCQGASCLHGIHFRFFQTQGKYCCNHKENTAKQNGIHGIST